MLWQLHALTGKQIWADKAQLWQKNLAGKQREFVTQHDWGKLHLLSTTTAANTTDMPDW